MTQVVNDGLMPAETSGQNPRHNAHPHRAAAHGRTAAHKRVRHSRTTRTTRTTGMAASAAGALAVVFVSKLVRATSYRHSR